MRNQIVGRGLFFNSGVLVTSVLLALVVLTTMRGAAVLDDSFHYGEYFAAATSLQYADRLGFLPITIHGALDFMPALMAKAIWGTERYLLPTYGLYRAMDFLAAVIFIGIAYVFTRGKPGQVLLLLGVTLVAPLLVGYRDLLLLASLGTFLVISHRWQGLHQTWNDAALSLALIFFGILAACALHWSYDRGLAGAISIGAAILTMVLRNRVMSIALLSFALCLAFMASVFDTLSFGHYTKSILILAETSSQWTYPWGKYIFLTTSVAVIFNLVALAAFLGSHVREGNVVAKAPEIIALVFLALCMLKIGTNRADPAHISMALWVPLLCAFSVHGRVSRFSAAADAAIFLGLLVLAAGSLLLKSVHLLLATVILGYVVTFRPERKHPYAAQFVLAASIVLSLGFLAIATIQAFPNGYTWMRAFVAPPVNSATTTKGTLWASQGLLDAKTKCVFDLTNNGIINGLTQLPSCSRFTYPVYADSKYEPMLIDDLSSAMPTAIVYSSTYWSYSIDGRDMRSRFPALDQYIRTRYLQEICEHGYCVRYQL